MKSLLKSMDIFFFRINFHYKNQKVFHSMFGLILSFLLYCVMIFFFYYFSKDFFKKTNPMVIFRETEFSGNFTTPLNKIFKDFGYSFFYNDTSGFLANIPKNINISNPVLYLDIYIQSKDDFFVDIIINENVKIENLGKNTYYVNSFEKFDDEKQILFLTGNSSEVDWNYMNRTNYTSKSLKNVILNIDQNSEIYLSVSFEKSYKTPFMEGELDISKFHMSYKISDNIMNVDESNFFIPYDNKEEIFIPTFKLNNFPYQTFFYNYGLVKLINDDGLILSEKSDKVDYKKLFDTRTMTSGEWSYLDIFKLRFDKVMKTYERKYKKLQNVFADLGGLMNSFIMIGSIIIYGFNKNKFHYELINNMFGVESNEDGIDHNKNIKFHYIDKSANIKNKEIFKYNQKMTVVKNQDSSSRSIGNRLNFSKLVLNSDRYINSKNFLEKFEKNGFDYISNKDKNINLIELPQNLAQLSKEEKSLFQLKKNKSNEENKTDERIKENIDNFIKLINKKKSKVIYFSAGEFLKIFLCCKNLKNDKFLEKEKNFTKLGQKINEYMNIINYCLLFENLEKLKMILLNENQYFTFNFLKSRKIEHFSTDKLKIDLNNVYKYFYKPKEELNEIDTKLLNCSCSNFLEFLN